MRYMKVYKMPPTKSTETSWILAVNVVINNPRKRTRLLQPCISAMKSLKEGRRRSQITMIYKTVNSRYLPTYQQREGGRRHSKHLNTEWHLQLNIQTQIRLLRPGT